MLCVLTQTIEDLLRLLAIGYDELCWPEQFGVTPQQIKDADYEDADYPPPPRLFREHVERTLGWASPRARRKSSTAPRAWTTRNRAIRSGTG